MKTIQIKETFLGSEDGVTVNKYEAGTTHNIHDELAEVAVENGWGEEVEFQSLDVEEEEEAEVPKEEGADISDIISANSDDDEEIIITE